MTVASLILRVRVISAQVLVFVEKFMYPQPEPALLPGAPIPADLASQKSAYVPLAAPVTLYLKDTTYLPAASLSPSPSRPLYDARAKF